MPVLAMHLLGNCRISCRNTSLFYTASETALTITALLHTLELQWPEH